MAARRRSSTKKPLRGRERGRLTERAFSSIIGRAARVQYFGPQGVSKVPVRGYHANFFDDQGRRYAVIRFEERAPTLSERVSLESIGRAVDRPKLKLKHVERQTWLANDLKKAGINRIRANVVNIRVRGTVEGERPPFDQLDQTFRGIALGPNKTTSIMAAVYRYFSLLGISGSKPRYRFQHQRRFAFIRDLSIDVLY